MPKQMRIFLAHASEDKEKVRDLYQKLKSHGFNPWLDEEDLLPGQLWRSEIPKALQSSDFCLACLSKVAVSKEGYIQREFRLALAKYADKPAGTIWLIPVRFDECDVPDHQIPEVGVSLNGFQWVDLWKPGGFERLIKAIDIRRDSSSIQDKNEANLPFIKLDLTGRVKQLTKSDQYYAILTDIVTKSDISRDLYVSIGEGEFVYTWITRIFREASPDAKPKVNRLILKGLSDELIDAYVSTNRLSKNFKNRMDLNLASILEDEQLSRNGVKIEIKYWKSFPEFHGYLYGDDMLIGEWETNDDGSMHVKSPLYYTKRQFFPKQYDFIKHSFDEAA
jgi:hypothetical protein